MKNFLLGALSLWVALYLTVGLFSASILYKQQTVSFGQAALIVVTWPRLFIQ